MATDGNTPTTTEAVEAQIKDLNQKAQAGDADARAKLMSFLDGHPDVWRRHGDLALFAQAAWFRLTAEQNPFRNECLVRAAAERRAELTRPDAPPAVRLLVERAVACGVQVDFFSMSEAVAIQAKEPPRLLEYWAKRHVQAQRSFAAALADLATIQNLLPAQIAPQAAAKAATKASAKPGAATAARSEESWAKTAVASTAKSATETSAKPTAASAATSATKASAMPTAAAAKSATKASAKPAAAMAAKRDAKPAPRKARRPRKAEPAAAVAVVDRIEPFLNAHAKSAKERLVGVH